MIIYERRYAVDVQINILIDHKMGWLHIRK